MEQNINNQGTSIGQKNWCGRMCEKWCWCGSSGGHKIISTIVIIFIIIFIIKAIFGGHDGWRDNGKIVNTITVTGKGEVMAKPDIATISFGVIEEGMDVAKAQEASAIKMNKIIDTIKSSGVEDKDIKTTNYSIYPRYDYLRVNYTYGGKQVLAGYDVSQTVQVKIRDLTKIGEILSAVGDSVTNVSGPNFSIDEEDTIKAQAKEEAIKNAREEAKKLAKSLGVRLVRITSFSEGGVYPVYYGMEKSMTAGIGGADAIAPEIPVGENTITSNVTITYEIR